MELSQVFVSLREGAKRLSQLTASQKNLGLLAAASSIDKNRKSILQANAIDVELSRQKSVPESLVDRLSLDDKRIDGIIESIKIVAQSEDPIGSEIAGWKTPEGLTIRQVRVPLGVAAIIYESRPNVTADAFALAYKSGNSILLRGSSSALNSNRAIVKAIKEGLENAFDKNNVNQGVPEGIALADSGERSEVDTILTAKGFIDVVLPRGGANLIKMVVEKATVPVIETGSGGGPKFIAETAAIQKAVLIVENAKLHLPGVCNAMETLLVHTNLASSFLPEHVKKYDTRAELRCCADSYEIIKSLKVMQDDKLKLATEDDFGFEFLDNILAIKVVENIEQAILHINSHNTKHSEAIITQNISNAKKFQSEIDASSVYVNASTRFTDGGVFGFGAELGISTQKFHVRGPMGLTALTTTKYLIDGDGHTR